MPDAVPAADELATPAVLFARPRANVFRRLVSRPPAAVSLFVLVALALVAVFAPAVAPHGFATQDLGRQLAPPGGPYPLGTDDLGRDLLSRLIYGARISLGVVVAVEAVILTIGLTLGLCAGYFGGWVDNLLMRLTDVMLAFPDVLLAILLVGILGAATRDPATSLLIVIGALGATGWPPLARLVRGQVLALRRREFVEAARALGATDGRIVRRHILPNLLSPVLVAVTVDAAGVIVAEATLSFLGIGVQRPYPSWGRMINDALDYYRTEPRLILLPSVALAVVVMALNYLGDGLRDALDPRANGPKG